MGSALSSLTFNFPRSLGHVSIAFGGVSLGFAFSIWYWHHVRLCKQEDENEHLRSQLAFYPESVRRVNSVNRQEHQDLQCHQKDSFGRLETQRPGEICDVQDTSAKQVIVTDVCATACAHIGKCIEGADSGSIPARMHHSQTPVIAAVDALCHVDCLLQDAESQNSTQGVVELESTCYDIDCPASLATMDRRCSEAQGCSHADGFRHTKSANRQERQDLQDHEKDRLDQFEYQNPDLNGDVLHTIADVDIRINTANFACAQLDICAEQAAPGTDFTHVPQSEIPRILVGGSLIDVQCLPQQVESQNISQDVVERELHRCDPDCFASFAPTDQTRSEAHDASYPEGVRHANVVNRQEHQDRQCHEDDRCDPLEGQHTNMICDLTDACVSDVTLTDASDFTSAQLEICKERTESGALLPCAHRGAIPVIPVGDALNDVQCLLQHAEGQQSPRDVVERASNCCDTDCPASHAKVDQRHSDVQDGSYPNGARLARSTNRQEQRDLQCHGDSRLDQLGWQNQSVNSGAQETAANQVIKTGALDFASAQGERCAGRAESGALRARSQHNDLPLIAGGDAPQHAESQDVLQDVPRREPHDHDPECLASPASMGQESAEFPSALTLDSSHVGQKIEGPHDTDNLSIPRTKSSQMRWASVDVAVLNAGGTSAADMPFAIEFRAQSACARTRRTLSRPPPSSEAEECLRRGGQSRLMLNACRSRVNKLEEILLSCEDELLLLEARLADFITRSRSQGIAGHNCKEYHDQAIMLNEELITTLVPRMPKIEIVVLKKDCHSLQRRLESLAADALECGCKREMFGAMDVFEAAGTAMERMAALLRSCQHANLEHEAPASCDMVEWRIVASCIALHEQEPLRRLLEAVVDCESCQARQHSVLLRFLRAQDGRVVEAENMFRASLAWRDQFGIESRSLQWRNEMLKGRTWLSQLVNKYKVHDIVGRDRLGLPVYLFRWSAFDVVGAERELGIEMVLLVILSIHEELLEELRAAMFQQEEVPSGVLYIWDIGNYGSHGVPNWWQRMLALVRFLPKVAKLLENNYPEVIRKIIVIRSGPATRALYHAATPFLPSKTLRKCKLCGWYAEEWATDLKEELPDISTLPAFLSRDDTAALSSAEPVGGLYPLGAADAARANTETAWGRGRHGYKQRTHCEDTSQQ